METIQQLEAKIAELTGKQDAILKAGGDNLTEAQAAEFDTLQGEYDAAAAKLATLRANEQRRLSLQNRPKIGSSRPVTQPGGSRIEVKGLASEADPMAGFKTPREYFTSVISASAGRMDDRLKPLKLATAGSDEHGEYSDAYGGYLIPEAFIPSLMEVQAETDPTAGRTTKIPMTAPTVRMNARTDKTHTTSVSGGLRVYRRAETQDVAASRFSTEQITLNAHGLMGLAYASEEVMVDSPISFAAMLQAGFGLEFGSKIIREKLRGTGVGEYEGILNTPCLVTVNKESGQSADTFLYANLTKMRSRCWRYSNAVWLYNHDCLPQLMNLADDFGRFIWQPSAREGEPDMIMGRPAYASEYCSTVGDVGDLILGVWSEYLEGQIGGVQSAQSMHVRFVEHEQAFKFWTRNDGKVWWRSALTPAVSSATLSPFVVLQAR